MFDALRKDGAKLVSTLALVSGHWQVEEEEDQSKTTISLPSITMGLYRFTVMLTDLVNPPATFPMFREVMPRAAV